MIVDTSVLVAIIKDESNSAELARVILAQDRPQMSAASYVEFMCVLARLGGPAADRRGDQLLAALGVEIVEVSVEQARLAAEAYRVFGKGSGHRAGLNFSDTFAYALAVSNGEPLLFVGDDFRHTDVAGVDARG